MKRSKVFRFGQDNCLVAAISDPPGQASAVGFIMWGLSVADMGTARSLAKAGLTTMQIHQPGEDTRASRNEYGVVRCREAMDLLRDQRGLDQFVLMGNCGSGSICFHTALVDERVVGIVLTNPHVSEVLSLAKLYRRRLLRTDSWRRLFTGGLALRRHLLNTRWLTKAFIAGLSGADEKQLVSMSTFANAMTMPSGIGEKLKQLGERGARTLIIFSRDDVSLEYFRGEYGESFEGLKSVPRLTLEVIDQTEHEIYRDDTAVGVVTDLLSRWVADARFTQSREQVSAGDALRSENTSTRRSLAIEETRSPQ